MNCITDLRNPVPNRTLHLDADSIVYKACNAVVDLEAAKYKFNGIIDYWKDMTKSETVILYVTKKGCSKGGRYKIAKTKPYQDHRKSSVKPEYFNEISEYALDCGAKFSDEEADDLVCQAAYLDKNACTVTFDKDFKMIPCLQFNPKTLESRQVLGYGRCFLADNKLDGYGTSFFWHQMLTGDKADNIPGLEWLSPITVCENWPTVKQQNTFKTTGNLILGKQKPCGNSRAVHLLKYATSDMQAFTIVSELYRDSYDLAFVDKFWEQAQLLWLRRTPNEHVKTFITEVVHKNKEI